MTGQLGASGSTQPRRLRRIEFGEPRRRGLRVPVAALSLAVLAPITALLVAALLFGWRFQPIESASMEPRLPIGSVAVVEPIDGADVRPGMVIVFEDPQTRGRLVAHRATRALAGEPPAWQTQGDANARPDPIPVPVSAIQGRVRWTVPVIGFAVSALRGPQGVMLLVGLPLAILGATEIRDWRRRRKAATHRGTLDA